MITLRKYLTGEGVLLRIKLRPNQRTDNTVGPAGGQGLQEGDFTHC